MARAVCPAKGIAFFCVAMLGRQGIQVWNRMAESRTKYLTAKPADLVMTNRVITMRFAER